MNWSEIFYYDEESPSCLRWAVDIPYKGLLGGHAFKRRIGDEAGTLHKTRENYHRWKVKFKQKVYMAHRIIWELHNGEIAESLVVDHIDGDATNNKITNLRIVSQTVNARNSKQRANNKTGTTGVTYREVNGYCYYAAAWVNLKGEQGNKYFPILKYGEELALFLAQEYRQHQIDLMNLTGAGYTARHGN